MLHRVMMAAALATVAEAETAKFLWEEARGGWTVRDMPVSSTGMSFAVGYVFDSQEWRFSAHTVDGVVAMDRYFSNGTVTPGQGFAQPSPVAAVLNEARKELVVLGVLADGAGGAQAVVATFSAEVPTLLRPVRQTVLGGKALRPVGLALGADGSVYAALNEWDVEQIGAVVARVSAAGELQWLARGAAGSSVAVGQQPIAVTSTGAAYVALRQKVMRVAADGAVEWTVDRPAETLTVRADDTVIVSTPLVPTGQTALLRTDGTAAWEAAVGGTDAKALGQRVWVGRTRFVGETSSGNADWELFQLDGATGAQVWSRQVGASRSDIFTGLAVDAQGNAYAAGGVNVRSGFLNLAWGLGVAVVKFDVDGAEAWRVTRKGHQVAQRVAFHADPARVLLAVLSGVIGFEVVESNSCASWMWWCQ